MAKLKKYYTTGSDLKIPLTWFEIFRHCEVRAFIQDYSDKEFLDYYYAITLEVHRLDNLLMNEMHIIDRSFFDNSYATQVEVQQVRELTKSTMTDYGYSIPRIKTSLEDIKRSCYNEGIDRGLQTDLVNQDSYAKMFAKFLK